MRVGETFEQLVNLRDRPNLDGNVVARLPRGSRLVVVGEDGDWFRVEWAGGDGRRQGWVAKRLVRF